MDELTDHAHELLAVIRAADDWIGRKEIADKLGKNRVNVWEAVLLERLERAGLIEAKKRDFPGIVGYEWIYKAK